MFLFTRFLKIFVCLLLFCSVSRSQPTGQTRIIDTRHYSHVFGEMRNYRIFLPPSYDSAGTTRFPVIYFFHGWSQRYFGDGGEAYAGFDKGDQNEGDNIANFVSKNNVIVVKWDGYNRSSDEDYYKRPYNVSPVETYRQFPLYFPELVNHIDDHYLTLADRQHRAVSGLSMGGFMSFVIGAKYPHLLSASGSFCGSPEFEIGPRTFPSEYRHLDMYRNFEGMNVRLHYGDKDFIRSYHEDMNRLWPQLMDNYRFSIFDAEHSTAGLGEMFATFMETFRKPPTLPAAWHHTDIYPQFSVWGYDISTDRNTTGFTVLENVSKRGFRSAVREFVPDGELLSSVTMVIRTAPLYEKNQVYVINDFNVTTGKWSQRNIRSDQQGRLSIHTNGGLHEIGINKRSDLPEIAVASTQLESPWVTRGKETKLSLTILNKGMSAAKGVKTNISAFRKNVNFTNAQASLGDIAANQTVETSTPFSFSVSDTTEVVKLKITCTDAAGRSWTQFIDLPVKKDLPTFDNIEIADGRMLSVANGGTDVQTMMLGKGNGDGIANPGESIVVLVRDSNRLWRTSLVFSDEFLNPFGVNIRKSDNWTNFDHVGASAKYHVPIISSDCPQDRNLTFFAEYWTPRYPYHIIKQGIVNIAVKGQDKTAPIIRSIIVHGDNLIEVRTADGAEMKQVKATLILKDDPSKTLSLDLRNDGMQGDRVENDNVFSVKIPEQQFGIYRVVVEASDSLNNTTITESEKQFVVH